MYTAAMAKSDLEKGWIDRFVFVPKCGGWYLQVSIGENPTITRAIHTARGELRIFKNLRAAINAAEKIGFTIKGLEPVDFIEKPI